MKVRNKKYNNFTMKPIEQELRDLMQCNLKLIILKNYLNIYQMIQKNYHDEEISNILISKFY